MRKFLPVLGLLILILSCKSRQVQPDVFPDRQLIFGSGGGITGAVTTYALLEDGYLYVQKSRTDSFELVKKVGKSQARTLIQKAETLGIPGMELNVPGNMYYFVRYKSPDQQGNVVWGDFATKVKPEIQAFYTELTTLTQITE
ncbi:MAG: hypothetical protein SF053_03825 [Bacteroidia bacterium]|nr:hypothetical protein [Bacteroidia bacterium]